MNKAGGIIALIAGIFATVAAVITLTVGGVGAAFEAHGAGRVLAFGGMGVAIAFLVIVFGAVSIFKPGIGAFALLLLSTIGAVAGGTLVAICLSLALVGGILSAIGAKGPTGQRQRWPWIGLPLGLVLAVTIAINMGDQKAEANGDAPSPAAIKEGPQAERALLVATPAAAQVVDERHLETRYGSLVIEKSEAGEFSVVFAGRTLRTGDAFSWTFSKLLEVGGADVALVMEASGGTACPAQFFFVTAASRDRAGAGEPFGTCSDLASVSVEGSSITVSMPNAKGETERFTYSVPR